MEKPKFELNQKEKQQIENLKNYIKKDIDVLILREGKELKETDDRIIKITGVLRKVTPNSIIIKKIENGMRYSNLIEIPFRGLIKDPIKNWTKKDKFLFSDQLIHIYKIIAYDKNIAYEGEENNKTKKVVYSSF